MQGALDRRDLVREGLPERRPLNTRSEPMARGAYSTVP